MPRVVGGRYGLSSKEFTPGHGRRRVRRARRASGRGAGSRSASTTTSPGTSLAYDATLDIEPPDTVRAVFFGLGSDGTVGANKNTIKILGAEDGPARPGLLRLRLEEVRLADRLAPALRAASRSGRPTSSQQASFVGCHQFGAARPGRRARPRRARARRCCSTARTRRTRCGTRCRGRVQEQILAKDIERLRDRRRPRSPARSGLRRAHQHRPADLLLRDLRRAAARRGDRADQGGDREDATAGAAPRSSSATRPRSTARSRGCTGSRCPTGVTADARAAAAGARATRRSSSAPSPPR